MIHPSHHHLPTVIYTTCPGEKPQAHLEPHALCDTPRLRSSEQAAACRAAGLDAWEAGYVAGVMHASGADTMPLDQWRAALHQVVAEAGETEQTLITAGLDPDDPAALSAYVQATAQVIQ